MPRLRGWISAAALCAALCVPAAAVEAPSGKPLPLYPKAYSDAYLPPFRGPGRTRISSGFGWRRHPILGGMHHHDGLDLVKPYGTPVYPAQNGIVTFAGWKKGYGWMVEIRHGDGARTLYGHLARYFFVRGQLVNKSMLLGLVGSSGLSTGPHLHFEYRDAAGRALDPRRLIGLL